MVDLTQEKALIFRITHIDNVPWILRNGVCCPNGPRKYPGFVPIGNADLIAKRDGRTVRIPPGGTLSDYVPFYFTPYSPMLFNVKTGYNGIAMRPMRDIAILVTSLRQIAKDSIPFVFTDRHAYLAAARFSNDLNDLDRIDWKILRQRDFKRDPNNPEKVKHYQAEALIHRAAPAFSLLGIGCYDSAQENALKTECNQCSLSLRVIVKPGWFF